MKDADRRASIVLTLLEWFKASARDLPWRRTRNPYAIWVSEIMLQQTQVKTVLPYWEHWMQALPNIQALAKASPQKIHKLWEGLGYYTRVRNIQRAAQIIVREHGGEFPREFEAVLALPGIGRYTAGAICSIAFNQPTPILDGNVIRVLTRLFGIKGDPREKKTNAKLWQIAQELVKSAELRRGEDTAPYLPRGGGARCPHRAETRLVGERFGERLPLPKGEGRGKGEGSTLTPTVDRYPTCSHLNQSLMELGALVCAPKNPRCPDCPLKRYCIAHRKQIVHLLPTLSRRPPATSRRFFAFVIKRNSRFLVRQRPAGVVNAHLWEFPNVEVNGETDIKRIARSTLGFLPESVEPARTIRHTITRYRITLEVFRGLAKGNNHSDSLSLSDGERARVGGALRWLPPRQLRLLPFTSAHKKILENL